MDTFTLPIQIRWSDIDPNFHVRHTVYFEWGAMCRLEYLMRVGLSFGKLEELHMGPILFREEAVYRREVRMGDAVTIDLKVTKAKRDISRCSFQHEIKKNEGILAALIHVDLAWMSGITRKLTVLPAEQLKLFETFPKSENFQWLD